MKMPPDLGSGLLAQAIRATTVTDIVGILDRLAALPPLSTVDFLAVMNAVSLSRQRISHGWRQDIAVSAERARRGWHQCRQQRAMRQQALRSSDGWDFSKQFGNVSEARVSQPARRPSRPTEAGSRAKFIQRLHVGVSVRSPRDTPTLDQRIAAAERFIAEVERRLDSDEFATRPKRRDQAQAELRLMRDSLHVLQDRAARETGPAVNAAEPGATSAA